MKITKTRHLLLLALLAVPAAAQEPPAPDAPAPAATSIDDLRKEYEKLREAVFSSRARAAAVGDTLYSTSLQVKLRYETGRTWSIRRASVRLDGANVFDDETGAITTDEAPRFSGFVAPGRQLLTIRIEAQAKDDAKFTYSSEETLVLDAPRDRSVTVDAVAREDGDMAYTFPRKAHGSYKLRLDVDVTTKETKGEAKK